MQNYVYNMVSSEFLKRERRKYTYSHRLAHTQNNSKDVSETTNRFSLYYLSLSSNTYMIYLRIKTYAKPS